MKHDSTRTVFDYWTERRGDRPAPERSEIDPGAIRHALGDTFMLAADFVGQHLIAGSVIPVGVVTGAVGAPYLLWLLARRGRRSASTGGIS